MPLPALIARERYTLDGIASYADAMTRMAARPNLFSSWYGATTETAYEFLDTTETYNGAPSLRFTYRTSPFSSYGWYHYDWDGMAAYYARLRFKLAPTYTPTDAELIVWQVSIEHEAPDFWYDLAEVYLLDNEFRFRYYRDESGFTPTVDAVIVADASTWLDTQRQLVVIVEDTSPTELRVRVLGGSASAALTDLDELYDAMVLPSTGDSRLAYGGSMMYPYHNFFANNDYSAWLYTAEYGIALYNAGPDVTYAVVVGGIVQSVETGPLPPNSGSQYNHVIGDDDVVPDVGWYFNDVCGTFSEDPPTIAPGDIAPPYVPGTNPPVPGAPDYPLPELPPLDDSAAAQVSAVLPTVVTFQTDATTTFTVSVPDTETPLDTRFHHALDLGRVCGVRLQVRVLTAVPGARLRAEMSIGGESGWGPLGTLDDEDGPYVTLGSVGYQRGDLFEVPEGGDSVIRLVVENGGNANVTLGAVSMLLYMRTDASLPCPQLTGCTPELEFPVLAAARGPASGALARENFRTFCDRNWRDVMFENRSRWWTGGPTWWNDILSKDTKRDQNRVIRNTDDSVRALLTTPMSSDPYPNDCFLGGINSAIVWTREVTQYIRAGQPGDFLPGFYGLSGMNIDSSSGTNYCTARTLWRLSGSYGGNVLLRLWVTLDTTTAGESSTLDWDSGETAEVFTAPGRVIDVVQRAERTAGGANLQAWVNGVSCGVVNFTPTRNPPQLTYLTAGFRGAQFWDERAPFLVVLREVYDGTVNDNPYGLL